MQVNILDRCPDNRQATGLRREHLNLISTLPYITKQTFNRIGGLNVSVQSRRKLVKRKAGALHPQLGFVPLLDSALYTWL